MVAGVRGLFSETFGGAPEVVAAAPGRIEFIGNHTDYNGGLVLGAAIDRRVAVAFRKRADSRLRLRSSEAPTVVEVDLADRQPGTGAETWANYLRGVLWALREGGLAADRGGEFAVVGDLPAGAGLSSSAALELATAFALSEAWGGTKDPAYLAQIGRRAENEFVGVPCGILDQGVSAFGAADHLVKIDCRGPEFGRVGLPLGVHFWIFNSGLKHALLDSLYAKRHAECREAFRLLQAHYPAAKWLAELTPGQVLAHADELGPALTARARHVTEEQARVHAVVAALADGDLATVGKALLASHASSRELFQNSTPELDTLVDLLSRTDHVWGARLTGGGFGGAVLAMTNAEFGATQAEAVAAAYAARCGHAPTIFHTRTGPGASVVG